MRENVGEDAMKAILCKVGVVAEVELLFVDEVGRLESVCPSLK
jgi:hypothetical protein